MKTIIFLGGSYEACHVIRRALDMGLRTVVVDGNPHAPGFALADRIAVASCYHAEPAIKALEIMGEPYDGVLCACVDAPHVAAAVAERFGLPGLTQEKAELSFDKLNQKRLLRNFGIPVPEFTYIKDHITLGAEGCVVKPCDSRGGRGVVRLLPDVDPTWAYEQAKAQSPTGRVMVEDWLDGPQLNSESIVQYGRIPFTVLSWRNYARLDEFAPYVIEDGLDIIQHDAGLYLQVNAALEAACRALGWGQAGAGMTVKGDLVLHNEQIYIIELAARLSGGHYATHTIPLAYGVPFVDYAIRFALGERAGDMSAPLENYVSQRYVFPAPGDIGKTVVSVKACDGLANYASWYIAPGDVIRPVRAHPDRWGQSICTGRTEADATARAEWAVAEMRKGVMLE